MWLMDALKTLFGTSDEEKELRRRAEEALEARKDGIQDEAEARRRLEEAQRHLHERAEQIRERQDSIHDEETPSIQRTSGAGA